MTDFLYEGPTLTDAMDKIVLETDAALALDGDMADLGALHAKLGGLRVRLAGHGVRPAAIGKLRVACVAIDEAMSLIARQMGGA